MRRNPKDFDARLSKTPLTDSGFWLDKLTFAYHLHDVGDRSTEGFPDSINPATQLRIGLWPWTKVW
jgi:hypothetical protein